MRKGLTMFLFGGMQQHINQGFFNQMPRRDQDEFLQGLYNSGYTVKEISKEFGIPAQSLYNRINAHRGRGVTA